MNRGPRGSRRPPSRGVTLVAAAVVGLATTTLVTGCRDRTGEQTTLRFWAMGREGEVVEELVRDFERLHPSVRVDVQQIPWSAAHEKLLTAHVGRSTPDLAQLGNTWIAEFAALRALEPLDTRLGRSPAALPETPASPASTGINASSYFPGIWDTNVIDGVTYGVPWYVDTRLLFYRKDLLERAGYASMPATWAGWRQALEAVKQMVGPERYAVFLPLNEWTQPVILGLQAGSPLLADQGTRGAFAEPPFRRAFAFYLDLFRSGLAPPLGNNEIANIYQEFARGYVAMYITGPWNLGEFRRRLPPELQDAWGTATLPGPDASTPGVSLAGGSSLVVFGGSEHKPEAWRLIEFLSSPAQQVRFYHLTGDLPARLEAWQDSTLAGAPHLHAFREQLEHVLPTPKVPEWEQIAYRVQERAEAGVRGTLSAEAALELMDRDAERILEKRRWLIERRDHAASR